MLELSPREIVSQLDQYIVGQAEAKRAIAIAVRNRQRRLRLEEEMQDEVKPKNLLMIGPTGVGKTEIARRLAKITQAPFIKVEATKYTEVGYVGRDVESMVRDLVEQAIRIVRANKHEEVHDQAHDQAVARLAKFMVPADKPAKAKKEESSDQGFGFKGMEDLMRQLSGQMEGPEKEVETEELAYKRREMRRKIRSGELDKQEVTIQIQEPKVQLTSINPVMEQMMDMQDSLNALRPDKKIERTVTVKEALDLLTDEESDKLVNQEDLHQQALKLAEESGIIFIDEMDKIASSKQNSGEVSRQGVQRDILPIVEGSQIQTKYGLIKTDHILFIGSGAFHVAKPSDLIPELQGRFPIRVHLDDLRQEDFVRILTEPQNALIKQYQALLATEEVEVVFTEEAIDQMADYAVKLNRETDNIGARRLHTIIETVLEELLFESADTPMHIEVTKKYVDDRLADKVNNKDLSHYIL
ncbi:ATP-dependent protease ATPase subunit HslU [Facklamia languida]|uniref:ATP-dependent protease HslVU, ATPase subunit n=1 Tax=Facklamia languida CCUG 37842 TaxID=883113 RepID=H3NKL4_9LACT|nr:ATP-dependent protease ATPase subunit HslU [Facklamia languida]EHR36397.1 ATP-dependent protease HslVU, ATPase subunit [Facklamia languida CCUG 37842]